MILNFNEFINENNNYENIKNSDFIVLSDSDNFKNKQYKQLNKADSKPIGIHYSHNT
jgi:hypothetical protein